MRCAAPAVRIARPLLAFWVFQIVCTMACDEPRAPVEEPELPAPAVSTTLKFGVLPAIDAKAEQEAYAPLAAEITRVLRRPVEVAVAKDYDTLFVQLQSGEIHLGQLSAYLYIKTAARRLRARIDTHVLAQQRLAAHSEHRGVLVVKEDSPYKRLADLAGHRCAFVDEASSSGFYYPRIKVRDLGFDPEKHFSATQFAGSHTKVVELVKKGEVAVGAVSLLSFKEATGLREILRTDVIPDDAIVSLGGLSHEEGEKLTKFFLGARTNPALADFIKSRGIERYTAPDVSAYLPQRKEMARTEPSE